MLDRRRQWLVPVSAIFSPMTDPFRNRRHIHQHVLNLFQCICEQEICDGRTTKRIRLRKIWGTYYRIYLAVRYTWKEPPHMLRANIATGNMGRNSFGTEKNELRKSAEKEELKQNIWKQKLLLSQGYPHSATHQKKARNTDSQYVSLFLATAMHLNWQNESAECYVPAKHGPQRDEELKLAGRPVDRRMLAPSG